MLRRRHPRTGFSLVELVISLAIAAMLLTAVAAAFTGSSAAIENNDQFFRASQAARVALNQLLTEIRRCNAVSVSADGRRIDLITDDMEDRSYVFVRDEVTGLGQLNLVTNDDQTDPDYALARNVSAVMFAADTATGDGGISYVARVTVTLIVRVGDNLMRLNGSAAPRRVRTYES